MVSSLLGNVSESRAKAGAGGNGEGGKADGVPQARAGSSELCDLLFELKYVSPSRLNTTGEALRRLDDAELRALPPVGRALAESREQIDRYRQALEDRFGNDLRLRCYGVVAVGFERLVGEAFEAGVDP